MDNFTDNSVICVNVSFKKGLGKLQSLNQFSIIMAHSFLIYIQYDLGIFVKPNRLYSINSTCKRDNVLGTITYALWEDVINAF